MKNKKLKLMLYDIAVKHRFVFYLIAALIVFIPMFIVFVTDNPFSPFYSGVFFNTAITFVIIGRSLTAFKKTIETGVIPWASIGSTIGILVVLLWHVLR